jgi:hypothetical protein
MQYKLANDILPQQDGLVYWTLRRGVDGVTELCLVTIDSCIQYTVMNLNKDGTFTKVADCSGSGLSCDGDWRIVERS